MRGGNKRYFKPDQCRAFQRGCRRPRNPRSARPCFERCRGRRAIPAGRGNPRAGLALKRHPSFFIGANRQRWVRRCRFAKYSAPCCAPRCSQNPPKSSLIFQARDVFSESRARDPKWVSCSELNFRGLVRVVSPWAGNPACSRRLTRPTPPRLAGRMVNLKRSNLPRFHHVQHLFATFHSQLPISSKKPDSQTFPHTNPGRALLFG